MVYETKAAAILIVICFAAGTYLYPLMPELMASHWDERGDVNGYMPKFWAVFLLPVAMAFFLAVLLVFPRIDPLRKNIESFRSRYDGFILVFTVFMALLYAQTLAWNLGHETDFMASLSIGFAVLFYYVGVLLGESKRNWFIGIRTPWTLSNDEVWERTHKLAAKMFKACAVIIIAGAVFPHLAIYLIMGTILPTAAYTSVYSYLEYRRIDKAKHPKQ